MSERNDNYRYSLGSDDVSNDTMRALSDYCQVSNILLTTFIGIAVRTRSLAITVETFKSAIVTSIFLDWAVVVSRLG